MSRESELPLRISDSYCQYFHNAVIWDGTENEPKPGELVTVANKIKWLTYDPAEFGSYSGDVDTHIDCQQKFLMPGLIEGHSHPSFPNSWDFDIPPEEHTLITLNGVCQLRPRFWSS